MESSGVQESTSGHSRLMLFHLKESPTARALRPQASVYDAEFGNLCLDDFALVLSAFKFNSQQRCILLVILLGPDTRDAP
jgi:hypothetical protein